MEDEGYPISQRKPSFQPAACATLGGGVTHLEPPDTHRLTPCHEWLWIIRIVSHTHILTHLLEEQCSLLQCSFRLPGWICAKAYKDIFI